MSFMFLSLFSCADAKNAPVKSMTSYSYRYNSGPAYNNCEYSANILEDGTCQIGFAHNGHGDTITVGGEVMKQIEAIYREHKIYNYKKEYRPSVVVHDGNSWGYDASFGEESFRSSGYNASPSDDGLHEINDIIINLIRKSYAKKYCDCTWEGAIKGNKLNVAFTEKDSVVNVSIKLSNSKGLWLSVAGELECYDRTLSSFHGKLKDQLSNSPKPVVTCVDVYVKSDGKTIGINLTGNDMTPLIEKGIEGATWEDHYNIKMKKTKK